MTEYEKIQLAYMMGRAYAKGLKHARTMQKLKEVEDQQKNEKK